MEENVTEDSILSTELRGQEIRIEEVPNEDTLVVYLSRGGRNAKESQSANSNNTGDIDKHGRHRADNCICLSKVHYEIDGDILCIREMKPFVYINKISILRRRSTNKTKEDTETQKSP
ncbi:similarity to HYPOTHETICAL PROTEINS (UPF0129 family) [Encephalitozoon cuniculi GB-M1]|uniref:Uncharacterized protein n=1 Tax=Encephalitozoon cuniculi (strain GB-M1) TaxID=284813 RepID=Q8STW2_ENCCU|nr:uncharacterized protein ECU09_0360 [Encephalitozoon cuniculi GB-M1]CAD27007.1 similarity to HYPOTHETICAL PROTEINS (UPF0129 family) [Encephalitozoon cuniculi GB-M1]